MLVPPFNALQLHVVPGTAMLGLGQPRQALHPALRCDNGSSLTAATSC